MFATIIVRHPTLADEAEFLARARRSRALHHPWITAPTTRAQFRRYLARLDGERNYAWLVCLRRTGAIVGVVNVNEVVRGAFRSGYLSYYVFAEFERRGVMRAGLRAVVRHAFGKLRLHRLEANIQPGNRPSIALAKSCGLSKEGYSPRYLKIGGRWRDHERWAILAS